MFSAAPRDLEKVKAELEKMTDTQLLLYALQRHMLGEGCDDVILMDLMFKRATGHDRPEDDDTL